MKVYDCTRVDGQSVTNRSRMTYAKQDGQVKALTFCQRSSSIACIADKANTASIHVFRLDGTKSVLLHNKQIDVDETGVAVDVTSFDQGSQNVLVYATAHGYVIGWDLRSPAREVWRFKNHPRHGLVTCFDVHGDKSWMSVGTSHGSLHCWDLRFQVPVSTVVHTTQRRVRRVLVHPFHQSTVIAATQSNNEVSFWDLETASRQRTLWASNTPALSQTQMSTHSVNGFHIGMTPSHSTFLLTAGSDMRIRYWDLDSPSKSQILVSGAADPLQYAVTVTYKSQLMEGTNVITEAYGTVKPDGERDGVPQKGHDVPPIGHHDIITDVVIAKPQQNLVITASRDGVVKVWN